MFRLLLLYNLVLNVQHFSTAFMLIIAAIAVGRNPKRKDRPNQKQFYVVKFVQFSDLWPKITMFSTID